MAGKRTGVEKAIPNPVDRIDWFRTANSGTEGIGEWDIKQEQMADAILSLLASGCAIMLGVTSDGGAVSVTIYSGDVKTRKYVTDAIELDDCLAAVVATARARGLGRFHVGNGKARTVDLSIDDNVTREG